MTAASSIRFGTCCFLTLTAGALCATPVPAAAVVLPGNNAVEKVDFERHVMGLFGRMGCNSGSCHGSFQGKGGFRLSLFGYDPEKDYAALSRESLGRRINPVDPDRSLLLLKATGQATHEGGKRFEVDSWQYQLLRAWIAGGQTRDKGSGTVSSITITPPELALPKAGATAALKVTAKFADGSQADITPLCEFRTNNDAVAEVSPLGQVKGIREGDTAIVVAYRGTLVSARVMVPREVPAGFAYPAVPEVNYIDREVFAKLKRLNVLPSDIATDTEFLRRVTLDTIGCLPTPEEVRAFVADKSEDKRTKKVDELLAHPMHAALWATKFCDITGNNTDQLEQPVQFRTKRSQMWHDWFRKRVVDNMAYDEIVRGVLCATSRDGQSTEDWIKQDNAVYEAAQKGFVTPYSERASLDLFWRRQQAVPPEQWGEKTAAAFLGIRLECAQCHKHPLDRWTQADYRAYANVFAGLSFGVSPEAKKEIDEANKARGLDANGKGGGNGKVQPVPIREVFMNPVGQGGGGGRKGGGGGNLLRHPDTDAVLAPTALGGPEIKAEKDQDPRVAVFEWLRKEDNPFFARSFVNRVWGHYFGIGIVNPVDDFSQANPPSNPVLLDALAKDFVDHKFDIRYIERTILLSRTYHLSALPNESNRLDRNNYSHSFVRPMMAEVVLDTFNSALGVTDNFGPDAPTNIRAIEVGASRINNPAVMHVFRIFGRPPRTSACDCERAMEPALPQTLYRMTDQSLLDKINAKDGRLAKLLKEQKSDEELLDELFLATLSRSPTQKEKDHFAACKEKQQNRSALFADVLWALVNTREFILNH